MVASLDSKQFKQVNGDLYEIPVVIVPGQLLFAYFRNRANNHRHGKVHNHSCFKSQSVRIQINLDIETQNRFV